jgi:Protein phosphatase 2C
MVWRIATASVIGTSHTKTGQPCQDSARVRLVNTPSGPILVSAVSDGAGSAAHSEIGSRAAVTTATDLIENFLQAGGTIDSIQKETVLSWLAQIQSVIASFAVEGSASAREFACTLLVAIIGPEHAAFFQVGDGAMVVLEAGDEGWSYIFWPQHGEYINSTNFVTSADAAEVMEFASVSRRIESFSSFSDGIESLVLHYATKTVHDSFFNAMIVPVQQGQAEGIDESLSESLTKYLSSDRVCERTDDDKSLVLATRSQTAIPSVANAAP